MNLGKKILLGYGLILILTTGLLIWGIINLKILGTSGSSILKENYRSIIAAEHMIDALERQDSALLIYIIGAKSFSYPLFSENVSIFHSWLTRAEDNITINGEKNIIETISFKYKEYIKQFNYLISNEIPAEFDSYKSICLPLFLSIRESLISLRELNQRTMYAVSDKTATIAKTTIFSMTVIGSICILTSILFSLFLTRLIIRPLKMITEASEELSKGNYEINIKSESKDELGKLAKSFNNMSLKLKAFHNLNIGRIVSEKSKNDAVIKSIDDGIIVIDEEMRIINANPAAEKALGFNINEENPIHFLESFNNPDLFFYIKQAVESKKVPVIKEQDELISIKNETATFHYQFRINPFFNKHNNTVGAVLLLRDITGLKKLDELKNEFLMTASHELKTPLTSIGLSLGLLQEEIGKTIPEANTELIDAAREEVNRLKALISDLLDLSCMEAGKVRMEIEEINVNYLLQKTDEIMRSQVEEKKIEFILKKLQQDIIVKVDINKFIWIFTNLISNALRYTEEGGRIIVEADVLGAFCYLSVEDTGIGIPIEYQSRIFNKFVQIKSTNNTTGTGLGLYICREIIKAHGGTIWVESEKDRGSKFIFTTPIVLIKQGEMNEK